MRIVWLTWYVCGVLSLLALLASLITYHPNIHHLGSALPVVFGAGAIVVGVLAIRLQRIPRNHQIHQPKSPCVNQLHGDEQ
jgi:hypothetical protein